MGKLVDYINNNCDFRDEYQRIFGKQLGYAKVFCPFHSNHNTPAAKVYGNTLKCFGVCNRVYTVYDLLKKFDPDRINEIKASVVLPEVEQKEVFKITIKPIDRSKSIKSIIESLL